MIIIGRKLNVFISYSHKDEAFKEALDTHLTMLKRSDKIATWNDRAILAGTEWDNEIKQQLANAHIIVLLVSASFLASDYIWKEELSHAMQRHNNGTARIIPVFIKACDWKDAPFGKIQGLPRDAKPIGTADNDEVWTAVAQGIRAVVADAQQRGIGVAEVTPINTPVDTPPTTNKTSLPMNQIKTLIAQGKLKQALDLLPDTNEFILLKARFSKLEREGQIGLITTSEANLESNRITHALLQMLDDDVVTTSPKPEMVNKSTTDFAAIEKALNNANWADVMDLLDKYFGDNPTLQYNILKQTIEHALTQGQQPNPATQQSLQMLINKLKKQ